MILACTGSGPSREAVEAERLRLEKERYQIASSDEGIFYDFDDTSAVFEFDLRHRNDLKHGRVIRQVQQSSNFFLQSSLVYLLFS